MTEDNDTTKALCDIAKAISSVAAAIRELAAAVDRHGKDVALDGLEGMVSLIEEEAAKPEG
jgi:hypothetical protein